MISGLGGNLGESLELRLQFMGRPLGHRAVFGAVPAMIPHLTPADGIHGDLGEVEKNLNSLAAIECAGVGLGFDRGLSR